MKNKRFFTAKVLAFLICLIFVNGGKFLFAQNFSQTLKWSSDPSVLEYKVVIQDKYGKTVKSVTTENNWLELSLKEGNYKYKITAYDLLGRESVSTDWINFEVAIAKHPAITHQKNLEALAEDGKTLEIAVSVDDVTTDTLAELVNITNGNRIKGKLILEAVEGAPAVGLSSSETQRAKKARFTDVPEGMWKLVITNPSGYSSETAQFEVRDVIKEQKIAAQKAEEERLAKLEAERKAKEEAERIEAERLAREKAEREEAERLAKEEADRLAREEAERLAREEAERLAREEKERLEREEAERLKQEELLAMAEKEVEEVEEEKTEEPKKTAPKKNKPVLGIEIKAGAGLTLNMFKADYLSNKNFDYFLKDQFPMEITPALNAAISYVPNLNWFIIPGIEISANDFIWENHIGYNEIDKWDYKQTFNSLNLQVTLLGQIPMIKNRVHVDLRAGGGITMFDVTTEFDNTDREKTEKGFMYPKLNGGLAFEIYPLKYLVFELGTDYNIILSNKINFSYLMPYLEVGVRF